MTKKRLKKHAPLPKPAKVNDGMDVVYVFATIAAIALVLSIMSYYGIKAD
jgi:hypothetical protein